MIIYVEREILVDSQCRKLYLCENQSNDEYLIRSNVDDCLCKKQMIILCKSIDEQCDKCSSMENYLFFKQNCQTNEILVNNQIVNVVQLETNELQTNTEIVHICQEKNLPKPIFEHVKNQLNLKEDLSTPRNRFVGFLLTHSMLVQSIHGMYSTFQQARNNCFQLRRYANYGYLISNIIVGIICSYLLANNFHFNNFLSDEVFVQIQNLTNWIKSIIEWLMHAPAGLKLNQPLVDFLARFYFYHIYLWSGYLEALIITVLPYLYRILIVLCLFGISIVLGAICDFIRLLTIHLYCFYIYAARLFNWQIQVLVSLFRLFCGKKQNPLRNNRIDSHLCDIDQLFIVTLTFTILLFLLPSIFMFYAVFTSIWIVTVFTIKLIQFLNQLLLQIPIYEFYLWITNSDRIRGLPRLSVDYGRTTEHSATFNFSFSSISFLTLYHVCNIHYSYENLSIRQLFLAILKGRRIF